MEYDSKVFLCSLIEREYMNISSKYTWMNQLRQSQKIAVISRWNIEGALQSPICITWLLNVPSTVANAVLWMCSGTMCICSYASDILSFDQYACNVLTLILFSLFTNRIWTRYIINGFLSDTSVRVMYKSEVA